MFGLDGGALIAFLGAVFCVGVLIGSIGIGGLLLAPMLVSVAGLEVREAIAISMASFMATGFAALWLFVRGEGGAISRWPLIAATMPGALAGALVLWAVPETVAIAVLAAFLVASGARVLLFAGKSHCTDERASRSSDAGIGAFTGFLSALTGTGGPMILVPTLAWRGAPLMVAIALGQVVQLPIAGVATVGNQISGQVDLSAAAALGVTLVPGVVAGRKGIEMVPVELVTRIVAVVLVLAGFWLALRTL